MLKMGLSPATLPIVLLQMANIVYLTTAKPCGAIEGRLCANRGHQFSQGDAQRRAELPIAAAQLMRERLPHVHPTRKCGETSVILVDIIAQWFPVGLKWLLRFGQEV